MVSKMEKLAKAKRPRRRFTDEFKAGAVALVLDELRPVAQVARDLDLTPSALGNWVERARADRSGGKTGLTTAEREELTALRRENRRGLECDPWKVTRFLRDMREGKEAAAVATLVLASDDGLWKLVIPAGHGGVIGRGVEADFVLDHETISSRHAMLVAYAERWLLGNAESSTVIYLNYHVLQRPTWLAPGDRVQLGWIELRVILA